MWNMCGLRFCWMCICHSLVSLAIWGRTILTCRFKHLRTSCNGAPSSGERGWQRHGTRQTSVSLIPTPQMAPQAKGGLHSKGCTVGFCLNPTRISSGGMKDEILPGITWENRNSVANLSPPSSVSVGISLAKERLVFRG